MSPVGGGRGKARLGVAYTHSSARSRPTCPVACIPDHEDLANVTGRVRATECRIWGNLVAREAWLALLQEAAE